jgi:hypothetical protein
VGSASMRRAITTHLPEGVRAFYIVVVALVLQRQCSRRQFGRFPMTIGAAAGGTATANSKFTCYSDSGRSEKHRSTFCQTVGNGKCHNASDSSRERQSREDRLHVASPDRGPDGKNCKESEDVRETSFTRRGRFSAGSRECDNLRPGTGRNTTVPGTG